MEQFWNPDQLVIWLEQAAAWVENNILLVPILLQIGACLLSVIPALLLRRPLSRQLARL